MHITTRALILREVKYKEADKIFTLLTPSHGKVSAKARGVLRRNSPLAAGCQLFAWSEFTLFEHRGYTTVNTAMPLELFVGLRNDAVRLSLAAYAAELLDTLGDSDESVGDLLRLGLNTFHALADRPDISTELIRAAFTLKALSLAGFEPHVEVCGGCGCDDGAMLFHVADGTIVCEVCRQTQPPSQRGGPTATSRHYEHSPSPPDRGQAGVALPLSPRMLEALRQLILGSDKRIFSLTLSSEEMQAMAALGNTYLLTRLEHGFKTLEFYKQMLAGAV